MTDNALNNWPKMPPYSGKQPDSAAKPAAKPEPSDLRAAIMNLRGDTCACSTLETQNAYKAGHKEARHAAAELVAATEASRAQVVAGDSVDTAEFRELLAKLLDAAEAGENANDPMLYKVGRDPLIAHINAWHKAGVAAARQAKPLSDNPRRSGSLYEAVQRACGELPDGVEVRIEMELGSGMVVWCDADGNLHNIDGEGYLCDDVNEAIDRAILASQVAP